MFSTLALSTLALSAAVVSAAQVDPSFDPFTDKADLQKAVQRVQALTTGTPFTTFCTNDANGAKLNAAAIATCKTDLAKELVTLQNQLVDNFFNAVVEQFKVLGSPFDKNKINNFDNNAECQREIDVFKQLATADAAACKALCGNVKLAADCLHGKIRDLLRVEQTKAAGEVDAAVAALDRAQLPVFDKVFNAAEQTKFLDISEDAARLKQSIDGFILGQIAQTAIELAKGNYLTYNDKLNEKKDLATEVQQLIALAKVELVKDDRLVQALKRLNALQKQPDGLIAKGAFDLAAKRVEKVDAPVTIIATISNFAAGDQTKITDAFKAVLGPETFFGVAVDDKVNAGKKSIDVAMGVDQSEIANQDSEFSIQCIKSQVDCAIKEDVHKATFDFAQIAAAAPPKNNGGDGYGEEPATHHAGNVDQNSASSLIVAVGAVFASIASLL